MKKKRRGDTTALGSVLELAPEGNGWNTCFFFGNISTSPETRFHNYGRQITFWEKKKRMVKYFITHFILNFCYFVLGLRLHSHIWKTLKLTLRSAVTTACRPSVLIPSVREIVRGGDYKSLARQERKQLQRPNSGCIQHTPHEAQ